MIRHDLHIHTTASDGVFRPDEVVSFAAAAGLSGLAVTDHDTLDALPEARAADAEAGLVLTPGVEISSAVQGVEVHILAYAFDEDSPHLAHFFGEQSVRRRERAEAFLKTFKERGLLPEGAQLPDVKSLGRPHLARLLAAHGTVQTMSEAFDRYLVPTAPTFIPKPLPPGEDVVEWVRRAGGVTSLAHPGHAVPHRVIMALIEAGLWGMEIDHPAHDDMLRGYYTELADRHGLGKTGGSDFHSQASAALGSHGVGTLPF